jgi:hypothetical protein
MINTEIMKDFLEKVREWEIKNHYLNVATRLIENMTPKQHENVSGICWEWDREAKKRGYGSIGVYDGIRQTSHLVHRLALSIATGVAPTREKYACHKCDNRSCFNPNHLYWGEAKDNGADYAKRGKSKIRQDRQVNASVERTYWWNKYKNHLFEEEYLKNPLTP